ncbi:tetratricopeptide repeat protein [uncultured Draconibacterium sp.]|uniref:tetratricopeptide repeat protein n=1 Tax=uncultured Draconibacterium sp. TaxID=1573823 RepID=UPI003260688D
MTYNSQTFNRVLLFFLTIVAIVFSFSCKKQAVNLANQEQLFSIYQRAEEKIVVDIDSAILLLDSVIFLAAETEHDSMYVKGLFRKADCLANQGNTNAADSIYSMLVTKSELRIDSVSLNKIILHYAHFNQLSGSQEKAHELCTRALAFFKQNNHEKTTVLGLIYLSDVYTQQNKFTDAMSVLTEALVLAENLDDKKSLALINGSLGKMYFRNQDYEKCLDCFNKVLAYNTQLNDIENIAVANQNIGTILLIMENYDEAEKYLLDADKVLSKAGLGSKQVHVLNSLGALYERQQKYTKAIETYNEVLELNKTLNNPYVRSNVYTNIGNVYYDQRNFDKTQYYYTKAHQALVESGETDFRVYYENMMFLNDEQKNWKEAYSWARKFNSHSDSIFNIEKYKETENLRTKYEAEKKDLQLEKMQIEQEKNKAMLLKNRIRLIGISILLLLTLIFGFVYQRQNRQKLQSYKDLVKKNQELIEINTSKRQQALLAVPDKTEVQTSGGVDKPVLPSELVQEVKLKLNELIDAKFYRQAELTLADTAKMLDTNTSYLSQIINDVFNCNFPSFLNQLRVEEAQRLLKNPEYHNLTIEGIGTQSGFKSKSVFNSAFKKITGVTPSFYKHN